MTSDFISRRVFMKKTSMMAAGAAAMTGSSVSAAAMARSTIRAAGKPDPLYEISLAEWSLNRPIFAGDIDHLDFAKVARELDITGIEYVNQFFKDKANDLEFLREMNARAEGEGVTQVLIMIDGEGRLGDPDEAERIQAVENHYKWVEAAAFLGCHTIRVNGYSEGSYEEQMHLVADGFSRLVEFADVRNINIAIENHGGYSSDANWVVAVMQEVAHPRVGTLPDFGNFRIAEGETYDSYKGTEQMMPYAMGVSVKPTGYDADGNRHELDMHRMMRIVLDAGYRGYCGIEYGPEGRELEGIAELRDTLIAVRDDLAAEYQ